jgi:hypothetical protein
MHEEKDPFPPEPPTVPRKEDDRGAQYRSETERFIAESLEPPPLWRDPRRRDYARAIVIGLVIGIGVMTATWWFLHH